VLLTRSSVYNRLCIERSPNFPKMGILGVGAKIFGWKVHPSSELRVFRHLWSRSDLPCIAFCMAIAICHRRKFGQVWGSPLPSSPTRSRRKTPRPKGNLWTFDYHMEKIVIILRCNPGL